MSRVVIIGAGVAGLAAAYRLLQLQPGWQVTILEQEAKPGGLALSMRSGEFAADLGPHRVYTELPEIEALLPELVPPDQMLTVRRQSELLMDGHFYQYPVRATELLRELGTARIAMFGLSAVAGKLRSLLHRPRDFEEAMSQAFGWRAYKMLAEPYTRKVWKIEPRELSEEVARVRVSAGNTTRMLKRLIGAEKGNAAPTALGSFRYIRGGVENLAKNLAAKVTDASGTIETDARVVSLSTKARTSDGPAMITSVQLAGDRAIAADFVISTAPVTDLVTALQEEVPDDEIVRATSGLRFVGMILVGLVIRRPSFTHNSWLYFPEEQFVFNRAYEPRNFDPSMAAPDRTMVVFEVTARWDSKLWTQPDDEVIAQVRRDAVQTGLVTDAEIECGVAVRAKYAYPIYTTDYRDRLDDVFRYLRRISNLISTGRQGLFNHNNMDHSMLMGIRAAEYAAEKSYNAGIRWYDDLDQFAHFRIVD